MNQYTLFSITSNMLLFRLNHSSCHAHASVEALQLAVVKPKLLYRQSLDCHELSVYCSVNLNTVNLMSLLLMPLIQKFNFYCSYASILSLTRRVTKMNTNAYNLPNCVSSSIVTSPIETIVNTDSVLLLSHLLDSYLFAWKGISDDATLCCSDDRILFVNNTCYDLFVSQLFTDEMVFLPKYVLSLR